MAETYTVDQLAKRLQVKPGTVRRWAKSGAIPSLRPSQRCLRFDIDAVELALSRGVKTEGGDR